MNKKILLLLVFLFSIMAGIGQGGDGGWLEKCCIDSKTGDTLRATHWIQIVVTNDHLLNFRVLRKNSIYTLELSYHFGRNGPFSVAKGDSIWLKCKEGNKIIAYASEKVMSYVGGAKIPSWDAGRVTQGLAAKYIITPQEIYRCSQIEKIRIFNSKGYNDIDWPMGTGGLVVQSLNLLKEKLKKCKVCKQESVTPYKENAVKDDF